MSAGASPQTPLGSLQRSPRSPKGPLRGRRGREELGGGGREMEGNVKGGERGKLRGGIAPCCGVDAPGHMKIPSCRFA